MTSKTKSPLRKWRETHNITIQQLALVCHITEEDVQRVEVGETGLPGELQDFLTKEGENVSAIASEQSAFIAMCSND